MSVSGQAKLNAIYMLSSVHGVYMDAAYLVDDINALATAWPDEEEFAAAVESTARSFALLLSGAVDVASLEHSLLEWNSFHYQHRRGQGNPADMRIVFRLEADTLQVLAFGHRSVPQSVYFAAASRIS